MGLFEMTNSEPGRFFRNHGYWLCKGVYDQSEIVKLERDFDRIVLQLLTRLPDYSPSSTVTVILCVITGGSWGMCR